MTFRPFDLSAIGAGLVVSKAHEQLEAAAERGAMVVTAPPGTGKTTFVPPLIANLVQLRGGEASGRTILTQPRRVAARAAARRLASLDGSAVGERVGYVVRGERRVSRDTAIEVVTPGVLLRRLLADPGLEGVDAVVLDEVHERSLDGDLLLGMLAEVRELRDDLRVVAMSATLDAESISELLATPAGAAPIVEVPSALHPLTIDYAPFRDARLDERGVTREFLRHVAQLAVREQHASTDDVLVFVPGAREVDEVARVARELASQVFGGSAPAPEVLPLHGRIPAREQDRAVSGRGPGDAPRIVVSTALAESALTVPGVRVVVDAGLSREVRRDRARDMSGLVTVSASRSSAVQRAGRAARQGPGRAVRAYSEADFARMLAYAQPEIASADLVDAAVTLAAWGTPGGRGLRLLTAPPAQEMTRAEETLRTLSLVDASGRITASGTTVARLPVGVREARALTAGAEAVGRRGAAEVVAALSGDARDAGADADALLRELRTGRAPEAKAWKAEVDRLLRVLPDTAEHAAPESARKLHASGIVTALARPEWIAQHVAGTPRSYLLASGTRAALPERSALIGDEWIAVREVQRADGRAADGTGAVIRLAARLAEEDALLVGDSLRNLERIATIDDGRVRVREMRSLGAITLSDTRVSATSADTATAFAAHLLDAGLSALNWTDATEGLRNRLALLHRELGAPWPDMSDDALLACQEDWIGPDLEALRPTSSLGSIDVTTALRRLLPWPEAAQLDALVPERLALPSGGSARIVYPAPGAADADPVVAAKLQELFGLATTPTLVDGRVGILFHLLSPARAPLAVTADLTSFWNGPYEQVRREMRGRYPRHPWPEDPWSAQATALTNRRLNQQR